MCCAGGVDACPTLFEPKAAVRKAIQDAKLPYTYVISYGADPGWWRSAVPRLPLWEASSAGTADSCLAGKSCTPKRPGGQAASCSRQALCSMCCRLCVVLGTTSKQEKDAGFCWGSACNLLPGPVHRAAYALQALHGTWPTSWAH